jgi:hypothetical protein
MHFVSSMMQLYGKFERGEDSLNSCFHNLELTTITGGIATSQVRKGDLKETPPGTSEMRVYVGWI